MDEHALLPLLAERVRALEDIIDGIDHRVEQTASGLRDVARLAEIATQPFVPAPRRAARHGGRHAAPRRPPHLYLVNSVAVMCVLLILARHLMGRWS